MNKNLNWYKYPHPKAVNNCSALKHMNAQQRLEYYNNFIEERKKLYTGLEFDDYWTEGDTNPIRDVCEQFVKDKKLSLVKVYNLDTEQPKIALYKNDTIHTEKNTLSRQLSFISPGS